MTGIFALVTTTPIVIVSLLIGVIAARLAYNAARRFEASHGVAAWHIPAGVWALFFFLSWLIGLLLFLLAKATTKARTVHGLDSYPEHRVVDVASLPLAGWYPDPGARHELRYWDGRGWTDYVRDGSQQSSDPH